MNWRNHTPEKIAVEERLLVSAMRRGADYARNMKRRGAVPPQEQPITDHLQSVHETLLVALEQTHNECVAEAIVLLESAINRYHFGRA